MSPHWTRTFTLALAALFLALAPARAGYLTKNVLRNRSDVVPGPGPFGSVLIEAYDGVGTPGGGLNAGEVRLTFSGPFTSFDLGEDGGLFLAGFQSVGFNTDLSLSSGQIVGPSSNWLTGSG